MLHRRGVQTLTAVLSRFAHRLAILCPLIGLYVLGNAAVINIAEDGSSLAMKPGWNISAVYYLPSIGLKGYHAFGNGDVPPGQEPIHVEIGKFGREELTTRQAIEGFRRQNMKAGIVVSRLVGETLANKKRFYFFLSTQNERNGNYHFLDGIFSDQGRHYYVCAMAKTEKVSDEEFQGAIPGILKVTGTWKRPRPQKSGAK